MKVLIAGKGFIGNAIGDKLSKDHQVKYLDRGSGDFQYDITKDFVLDEKFDVLIHTVGLAPGFATKEQYEAVHVEGTKNLLEAVNCEKVIYLSALGVGDVDHSFFQTKGKAEKIVRQSENKYTILRPSTVYGQGNKLLDMIRKLAPTRLFPAIPAETQPIMINDLTELIAQVLESHDNQVLNAAGPEVFNMSELARNIYNKEGYGCLVVPAPEFMIKLKLSGLSFLGPPFQSENMKIFKSSNTADENNAENIVSLHQIDF